MSAEAAFLHHHHQARSCRPHCISLLYHTVPAWASSLLLHRPLCLSLSQHTVDYNPPYLCVHMLPASTDGGMGLREISLFHWEQYPFWCISALFVSLTRTNKAAADRRRIEWREGKCEWAGDERESEAPSSLGSQGQLIIYHCFMAVGALTSTVSCIFVWIVVCSSYLQHCG